MTNPDDPNHSHAWRGTWNRPMLMNEDELHPFTVARMTDHNVKGTDLEPSREGAMLKAIERWERDGGIVLPDSARLL